MKESVPMSEAGLPIGRWNVEFANGVMEKCVICKAGIATVVEPRRTSGGKAVVRANSAVITFDDDRVERWTHVGKRFVVEHWFPGSRFPNGTPVLGIAGGDEPTVIFDNRPEFGIPLEAEVQMRAALSDKSAGKGSNLESLAGNKIKTVRIRYFDKNIWASEKQVSKYIAGFLTQKLPAYRYPFWSEGLGEPQIECIVEFTDDYRNKLIAERKPYHEGQLLIWATESCFRDATGKWWFIGLFDYFHRFHRTGSRELARPEPKK